MTAPNRLGVLIALAVLLVTASAASGEDEVRPVVVSYTDAAAMAEPAVGSSSPAAGDGGFTLGLELIAFDRPGSFGLFAPLSTGNGSRSRLLPPGGGSFDVTSPRTSGLDGLSAELAWKGDRVPDGLRFDFGATTWDELDGWEKTGLVMSRASAAAGLGYLLYRLFD